jgi:hypothetical protein
MTYLEKLRADDSAIPVLVTETKNTLVSRAQIRDAESMPRTVLPGIELTAFQVIAGSISLLYAVRVLLWAVFKLWLFQP